MSYPDDGFRVRMYQAKRPNGDAKSISIARILFLLSGRDRPSVLRCRRVVLLNGQAAYLMRWNS